MYVYSNESKKIKTKFEIIIEKLIFLSSFVFFFFSKAENKDGITLLGGKQMIKALPLCIEMDDHVDRKRKCCRT